MFPYVHHQHRLESRNVADLMQAYPVIAEPAALGILVQLPAVVEAAERLGGERLRRADGAEQAADALDSGRAEELLTRWIAIAQ